MTVETKEAYDAKYARTNYFRHREWLYGPFISSLVRHAGLKVGSAILDVGCGQGFFSYLLHKNGMNVHGIDLSEAGIRVAQKSYGRVGLTFQVADLRTADFPKKFDCIFVRSCSLYNDAEFASSDQVTSLLLRHLKAEGVFLFTYNSKVGRQSATWRYHTLSDVKQHFKRYASVRTFFCNRLDTLLLGKYAFNSLVTRVNTVLSGVTGAGGELVCVLNGRGENAW